MRASAIVTERLCARVCVVYTTPCTANPQELFNSSSPRYTAIHMRLGGMAGESHIPFVRGGGAPFNNFLKAAQCAQRLAKHNGLPLPILMVVDSNEVRDALKVCSRVREFACVEARNWGMHSANLSACVR